MICQYDIIKFIKNRLPVYNNYSDDEIQATIDEHKKYGTWDEMRDGEKIIALIRYNIDGPCAEILDIAIEDGYDSSHIMRRFCLRGWERFPYVKYYSYHRIYKYPLRKLVICSIKRLLKLKEE